MFFLPAPGAEPVLGDVADDLIQRRVGEPLELHLGHADFEQRFRNFLSLLAQVGGNGSQIDSMDLRYGGQVVVNPRRDVTRADPARPAAASRTRKE